MLLTWHTGPKPTCGDKMKEHIQAEITLTIICSSRESIATMLSKYVLCEKKKWRIEMFDRWRRSQPIYKISWLTVQLNLLRDKTVVFDLYPEERWDTNNVEVALNLMWTLSTGIHLEVKALTLTHLVGSHWARSAWRGLCTPKNKKK